MTDLLCTDPGVTDLLCTDPGVTDPEKDQELDVSSPDSKVLEYFLWRGGVSQSEVLDFLLCGVGVKASEASDFLFPDMVGIKVGRYLFSI